MWSLHQHSYLGHREVQIGRNLVTCNSTGWVMRQKHKFNVNCYQLSGIKLMTLENVLRMCGNVCYVWLSVCRLWVSCRAAEYRSWSLSLVWLLIRSQEGIDCFGDWTEAPPQYHLHKFSLPLSLIHTHIHIKLGWNSCIIVSVGWSICIVWSRPVCKR